MPLMHGKANCNALNSAEAATLGLLWLRHSVTPTG